LRGLIVKALSGFWYVDTGEAVYRCRARGLFKKQAITPLVGDTAEVERQDDEEGFITEIMPRRNEFVRPPIANIDAFAVVISTDEPELNTEILDRFLVTAAYSEVEAVICLNKTDLAECSAKARRAIKLINEVYAPVYPVLQMNANSCCGLDGLKVFLRGKSAAFTGPSGVGKTSILNALLERNPDGITADILETGSVSRKTGRGRHTTRHVEIFSTDFGAKIFDTPGYTAFETTDAGEDELDGCYPEFAPYLGTCRYDDCRHSTEPGCGIIAAAESGEIARTRYDSYIRQLNAIKERKDEQYK
jgi:ribosome biogenesis GTPase